MVNIQKGPKRRPPQRLLSQGAVISRIIINTVFIKMQLLF